MTIARRLGLACVAIAGLLVPALAASPAAAGTLERWFAPSAKLWERWTVHDPASTRTVDHRDWDLILGRYRVAGGDGIARFAYGKVNPADRQRLAAYLERLSAVAVGQLARPEQFALWVNLYNALTVKVVLDHYPIASIRDLNLSPGLFASGPWDAPLIRVEGVELTLNDIEHRILRPIWHDPRVHYAVNCASLSCPDLAVLAYTGATVDAMLDAAARAFVNHPRALSLSPGGAVGSKIYLWFSEDFGGTDRAILDHLRRYAGPVLRSRLDAVQEIADYAYDWSLNDAR